MPVGALGKDLGADRDKVVPILRDGLGDKVSEVRLAAILALGELGALRDDDRKSNLALRMLYRRVDPTMEYAENNYYHLLIQQQLADLVNRVKRKELNTNQGREILDRMIDTGEPAEVIIAQVSAVASDIGVDAVKIGMLANVPTIEAVAQALCMKTEDFSRAYRAFAAKQKPAFEGN